MQIFFLSANQPLGNNESQKEWDFSFLLAEKLHPILAE
jgi:hypothetical protein